MAKYRKKPVVIDAIQWNGKNIDEIKSLANDSPSNRVMLFEYDYIIIVTLEGEMRADKGDYIIKGVQGEFYPCKPDIFRATYEFANQKGVII